MPPMPGASEIRDGDRFAVTLPEATKPCFLYPPTLYDAASCGSRTPAVAPEGPGPLGARVLTLAQVDLPGAPQPASVTLFYADRPTSSQPTPEFALAFTQALVEATQPPGPGAAPDRPPMATPARIGAGAVAVVRSSLSWNVPGTGVLHAVGYVTVVDRGLYAILFAGVTDTYAVDDLADATIQTLALKDPAPAPLDQPPSQSPSPTAAATGQWVFYVIAAAVLYVGLRSLLKRDTARRGGSPPG
jgi:hypothetical protein